MKFAKILENAWSVVDSEFDEEFILGPAGAQFVKTHAIKRLNDTFNVVMTLVCAMASLTNGVTIAMFPGQDSPLNCVAALVGFPKHGNLR